MTKSLISTNPPTFETSAAVPLSAAPPDLRVGTFASAHHGLITPAIANELGMTRKALRHRVAIGQLQPVQRGVLRCTGAPQTTEQLLLAACWSTGSGFASHRSALHLWGIDVGAEPVMEITVPRSKAPMLDAVGVHRSKDWSPEHGGERRGVPVTTMARTIVDLGDVLPPHLVERVLEIASYRKLTTVAEVRALREELSKQGRNGVGVIGEVLDRRGLGDIDSNSPLESLFANLRRDHDLDPPTYQFRVRVNAKERIIDFAWPAELVAVELQGFEFHSRFDVFQADRIRGNELRLAGWQVLEFTWDDVVHRPEYVAACIRRALAAARACRGDRRAS